MIGAIGVSFKPVLRPNGDIDIVTLSQGEHRIGLTAKQLEALMMEISRRLHASTHPDEGAGDD